MALFWFYIFFSVSVLLKDKKVLMFQNTYLIMHIVSSYHTQVLFINKSYILLRLNCKRLFRKYNRKLLEFCFHIEPIVSQ